MKEGWKGEEGVGNFRRGGKGGMGGRGGRG